MSTPLTKTQYKKAKARQAELATILNRLSQDLLGDDPETVEKIWRLSFHFTDLGYVLSQLREAHDFWFQEGDEYNEN